MEKSFNLDGHVDLWWRVRSFKTLTMDYGHSFVFISFKSFIVKWILLPKYKCYFHTA